jgi:hypothetical protein
MSIHAQDEKKVLTDLVNEFLAKVDSKEMHDRFWAEDLTYTSSSGTRFGKDNIMNGFKDEPTEPSGAGPTYSAEDLEVKLFDGVAVVAFKLIGKEPDGTISEYLNSGTFVKRKGQWKVVNWQATKIPGE